jgi:hypothetical protein
VYDLLLAGQGGAIVVVCDTKAAHHLQIDYLDNGKALGAFLEFGRNLHQYKSEFEILMKAFSVHTASDRWEPWLTQQLAEELEKGPEVFKELIDEAKDGAIVLSLNGTVLAAAARLRHLNQYMLVNKKGRGAGTRHSAAMGVVEWMSNQGVTGVVFVRSDSGAITTMVPTSPNEPPRLFTLKRTEVDVDSDDDNITPGRKGTVNRCYRPLFLKLFGLMPSTQNLKARTAQYVALILACCMSLAINMSMMFGLFFENYSIQLWDRHSLVDSFFSGGVLISVILFPSALKISKVVEISEAWAKRSRFGKAWGASTRRKTRRVLFLWLISIGARAVLWFVGGPILQWILGYGATGIECENDDVTQILLRCTLDVFAYVVSSGAFTAMALLLLYVLGALKFSRNHFVGSVVALTDYDKTIRDWNMIQAFFFELSSSVEFMFVCFVGSISMAVLHFARERAVQRIYFMTSTHISVPLAALTLLATYVLLSAQNLTESCTRAPSVINSLISKGGRVMDQKRHFLVEYVKYSDPGFRVFGRLITGQTTVLIAISGGLAILILFSLNLWYGVTAILELEQAKAD